MFLHLHDHNVFHFICDVTHSNMFFAVYKKSRHRQAFSLSNVPKYADDLIEIFHLKRTYYNMMLLQLYKLLFVIIYSNDAKQHLAWNMSFWKQKTTFKTDFDLLLRNTSFLLKLCAETLKKNNERALKTFLFWK